MTTLTETKHEVRTLHLELITVQVKWTGQSTELGQLEENQQQLW